MKPRLLDLFCGAGGCTKGYQRAGFYVTGVDIKPQPNYCGDEFVQWDALDWLDVLVGGQGDGGAMFDAIHASPPCQAFTSFNVLWKDRKEYVDLLTPTRALLQATDVPWVIENVPGAPMRPDAILCGSLFDLGVRRHRWFEFNEPRFEMMEPCRHDMETVCVVGHGGGSGKGTKVKRWSKADGAAAMGIDWMSRDELAQAIPPAYTEWIGQRLIEAIKERAVA